MSTLVDAGIVQIVLGKEGIKARIAGEEPESDVKSDLVNFLEGTLGEFLIIVDAAAELAPRYRQILRDNPSISLVSLSIARPGADLFQYRLIRENVGKEGWLTAIQNAFESVNEDAIMQVRGGTIHE